jgi:protein tyrosine phosphatase (PTP) superfamily phosphohydrolase (DUF442 family)
VRKYFYFALVVFVGTFGFSTTRDVMRNFHVVDPARLYRSAKLSPDILQAEILHYGIKTVINLTGAHPDDQWYIDEKAILNHLGVKLVDIPMRTERMPSRSEITALFDAFDHVRRPILLHCNSGADRTGEASAIYEMEYMKKTKEQALAMLSPYYLHVEFFAPSKDYFIGLYQGKNWALTKYDPCKQKYQYFKANEECHTHSRLGIHRLISSVLDEKRTN